MISVGSDTVYRRVSKWLDLAPSSSRRTTITYTNCYTRQLGRAPPTPLLSTRGLNSTEIRAPRAHSKPIPSDARRQIGEAARASDDGVELGEFLVAPVVAAFGDELARHVELLPRLLPERGRRGGVGRERAAAGSARRGRSAARKPRAAPSASRARSSAMSQRKSRIGPGSAISSASSRSRAAPAQSPIARRKAARARRPRAIWPFCPGGAQAFDGLVEPGGSARTSALAELRRRPARRPQQRQGEMGAAEGQSVERDVQEPNCCRRAISRVWRRPVARGGGLALARSAGRSTDTLAPNTAGELRVTLAAAAARRRRTEPSAFPPCAGGVRARRLGSSRRPASEARRRCGLRSPTAFSAVATAAATSPTSNSVSLEIGRGNRCVRPVPRLFVQCASSRASPATPPEPPLRAQRKAGLAENPGAIRRRQRGDRRLIRPVEEPGDRGEIAADGAQLF